MCFRNTYKLRTANIMSGNQRVSQNKGGLDVYGDPSDDDNESIGKLRKKNADKGKKKKNNVSIDPLAAALNDAGTSTQIDVEVPKKKATSDPLADALNDGVISSNVPESKGRFKRDQNEKPISEHGFLLNKDGSVARDEDGYRIDAKDFTRHERERLIYNLKKLYKDNGEIVDSKEIGIRKNGESIREVVILDRFEKPYKIHGKFVTLVEYNDVFSDSEEDEDADENETIGEESIYTEKTDDDTCMVCNFGDEEKTIKERGQLLECRDKDGDGNLCHEKCYLEEVNLGLEEGDEGYVTEIPSPFICLGEHSSDNIVSDDDSGSRFSSSGGDGLDDDEIEEISSDEEEEEAYSGESDEEEEEYIEFIVFDDLVDMPYATKTEREAKRVAMDNFVSDRIAGLKAAAEKIKGEKRRNKELANVEKIRVQASNDMKSIRRSDLKKWKLEEAMRKIKDKIEQEDKMIAVKKEENKARAAKRTKRVKEEAHD